VSRILIAEDEERLAAFLEKGLRASGFVTTVAADGITASALAHDDDFDLMILDLGLPGKDGLQVLRDLRASGEQLPVIVLTARSDPYERVEGLETGADDYLSKPFHFEELVARIRVQLRDHGSRAGQDPELRVGEVALDLRTRWVSVG
jgi:DNA-binding response OmpR family regulator